MKGGASGRRGSWLTWLHRVGYLTTALVLAEVALVGTVAFNGWRQNRDQRAAEIERTRTHAGPLLADDPRYRPDELDLLQTLEPLSATADHDWRFVAMPSLSGAWFAYVMTTEPGSRRGHGTLVAFRHGSVDRRFIRRFTVSADAARRYMARIARLTDRWDGERDLCVDGTGVAFELRSARGITSGSGNSGCSEHYRAVARFALEPVRALIPPVLRPRGGEWRADRWSR